MWCQVRTWGESSLTSSDFSFGFGDLQRVAGFESGDSDEASCFGNSDEELGEEGLRPGLKGTALNGMRVKGCDLEEWIQELLGSSEFTDHECWKVLQEAADKLPITRRLVAERGTRAGLCGLYAVGGFTGMSNLAKQFPALTRYLNRFLKSQVTGCAWTTIYISHNNCMSLHRDLRNALDCPIVVRAVGDFKGGGLWLEDGDGPACRKLPNGGKCIGTIHDLRKGPVVFSGTNGTPLRNGKGIAGSFLLSFLGSIGVCRIPLFLTMVG